MRAAGNALGSNPMPVVVPCHRVVRTGGGLGGYTGGMERKEFLLGLEGLLPGCLGPRLSGDASRYVPTQGGLTGRRPRRPPKAKGSRLRGHHGSTPRGNPPLDRHDLERSVERWARVLGH